MIVIFAERETSATREPWWRRRPELALGAAGIGVLGALLLSDLHGPGRGGAATISGEVEANFWTRPHPSAGSTQPHYRGRGHYR